MPLLQLSLTDLKLAEKQRSSLLAGLTQRMASILGKRADLTVVNITQSSSNDWSLGGASMHNSGWCASLMVHITTGTNTPTEQATFITSAYELLSDVLERPQGAPVYIVINEIAAHSWGYDGRTQLDRRVLKEKAVPKTLFQMAGAEAPVSLGGDETALMLIDFQNEYGPQGQIPLPGIGAAAAQAQRLVAAFDARKSPVIHVHHKSRSAIGAPFSAEGDGVLPLPVPQIKAHHHLIGKALPSAFTGTNLHQLVKDLGIKSVVIAGAMTHNCVDSTARAAMHLGLQVVIAEDACATRAIPGSHGLEHSADQVHSIALAALADRHAFVVSTREVIAAI